MEAKIRFVDESLRNAFQELETEDIRLFKEVEKALSEIHNNAFCGRNVKKELIPKSLIQKYQLRNLWIYNLRKDWRLLYTVSSEEIGVIAIILNWMNHKDYERLFGF
jgi:Txe/YoeB family toxin of Txe-Axe toxin-antitoxin module